MISILHGNVLHAIQGRENAKKVVEFVAKWLNLCLSKVIDSAEEKLQN